MKKTMRASSIRTFLVVVLVLLLLVIGAGFYYGVQQVKTVAIGVNHTAADAEASDRSVEKLAVLKKTLADSKSLVDKANKLFTTPASYQSQALQDVQKYANDFGLTISNTNFDNQSPDANVIVGSGKNFTITLQAPVGYKSLLKFLDAIEGNLPKMQLSSITLSRPENSGADSVGVGDITITVSTR